MLKTFKIGGVHPEPNKISAGKKIVTAALPKQAVFPLSQHIGAPAVPCVQRGDTVLVGTRIADPVGFVSAAIHSSVSGKVAKIDTVVDTSGFRKPAIFIDVEGDKWESDIDRSDTLILQCTISQQEIFDRIKNAGIVGLGGACFPTHVKLMPPKDCKIDTLIINAAECEPFLTADHRLMLEYPDQIIVGIRIMLKALGIEYAVIGIEENKPDAIALMRAKTSMVSGIEVVPLKMKYPQGGEKQLIEAVTGRRVPPPPALPASVGCVVQNIGTVFAVYEAVQKRKPLIERIVTVTGKSVQNPSNLKVRLGTPISQLIEAAGGLPEDTSKIVSGGPMMGRPLLGTDVPVVKGTSGILMIPESDAVRHKERTCIRCGKCITACPMGLEPYLLAVASEMEDWERAEENWIMSCIECGCCQSTCPSRRPLLDWVRLAKNRVNDIIRARNTKI
ncbi:MAG TPA: electron transport complex subunit RsxC [Bacteroidaceae bacterium]|jgi:electron transport complex protein RnfC|nr:electron transport complex subunit RsxC [Bacteroidaceae bacterium]HQL26632.1 electron transport complex subunit RsxC [Bacteroidaceae bacterium]